MASPTPVPSLTREHLVPNFKKHISVDAFSNVFKVKVRCEHSHEASGKLIALKLFKEDKSVLEDVKSVKSRELRILQTIGSHPFIVKFYGMYLNEGVFVGLLFEYAPLGNWEDFIYEHMYNNGQDFFSVRSHQAIGCAEALTFLRSRNIVHGDVFIENVLVVQPNYQLKISNFGSSFCTSDNDKPPSFPYHVDDARCYYLAPEKRTSSEDGKSSSTFESDVFSFGVLLYFAFFREDITRDSSLGDYTSSWEYDDFRGAVNKLVEGHKGFPSSIATLILRCMKMRPKDRISIEDAAAFLQQREQSLLPNLQEEMRQLSELVFTETEEKRGSLSNSISDFFALSRPNVFNSLFTTYPNQTPVYGAPATAVSPLSAFFPNYEKRGLMDPNDGDRDDLLFQRASSNINSNFIDPYVVHTREDIVESELKEPLGKPSDSVIKSIMHHRDIQRHWRRVLLYLGMKENDLRLIEERAKAHLSTSKAVDDAAIVHYALDSIWLEQRFQTATRRKLLDALIRSECYDSAYTFLNLDYDLD